MGEEVGTALRGLEPEAINYEAGAWDPFNGFNLTRHASFKFEVYLFFLSRQIL